MTDRLVRDGATVYRTDRHGSIVVHGRADGGWKVEVRRPNLRVKARQTYIAVPQGGGGS